MTRYSKDENKPIVIKPNSLDYDYKSGHITGDPFESDDWLKCGSCGCLVVPSSNNFFTVECPGCDIKWIKGDMPLGYITYSAIRIA